MSAQTKAHAQCKSTYEALIASFVREGTRYNGQPLFTSARAAELLRAQGILPPLVANPNRATLRTDEAQP